MKNLPRVKKFPLSPPSGANTPHSAAGHLLGSTRPTDIQRKILHFFFFFQRGPGISEPRKKDGQLPQVAHRWRGKAAGEGSIFLQLGPTRPPNSREWSRTGKTPTVPRASPDVAPRASLPTR